MGGALTIFSHQVFWGLDGQQSIGSELDSKHYLKLLCKCGVCRHILLGQIKLTLTALMQ